MSTRRSQNSWDIYYLGLAEKAASMSKDPSTKVGAVLVMNNRLVSTGYNGFPEGIVDSENRLNDRAVKLKLTIHAEHNAILTAKCDLQGATLYTWPFPPCSGCSLPIIQSGIKRVVSPPLSGERMVRWAESVGDAQNLFQEARIVISLAYYES